ncbi:hypothetical protein BO79DRAFT_8861 [Aspergillus costaricaensis CBS 115574]|uniref:Uncharacterized protein n=1 Tax=Aspergillus costaricaensis CBS 115574 TaxID=1448317 RepID=A0ACD1IHK1_9EURO|nr:hypothetical protein BO79DRAFT_8861 [Aspergillus costaricaensis CBS 115574]RAK89864.1 hypothetical protein BO79DRAFT_8861 [Aspergillus costaricaensis CBS 115574]
MRKNKGRLYMKKISPGSLTGQSSAAQRLIHLQMFVLFAAFALFGGISHQKNVEGNFLTQATASTFFLCWHSLFLLSGGFSLALDIFWKAIIGFL